MCVVVPINIQEHVFIVDFFILPLQAAKVVLGVQWLQLLRLIILDYQKLGMSF